ncbi:hypothetical protein DFH07DRAFT_969772 [Mycena maculata]|uniref:Uncharacterized protein n=1 Tax=Mycena maculata TaxID=230809 RepID=A0AAD7HW62_9AGAR|nr:hypothetical protein DFH07DRAFT_969772 [Mycena maculata]
MSQPLYDPNSPWVRSPKGAIYVRDPSASYWKGPRQDRVFVPSLDWPAGMQFPPDFDAEPTADEGAHSAPPAMVPVPPPPQLTPVAPAPPPIPQSTAASVQQPLPLNPQAPPPPYSGTGLLGHTLSRYRERAARSLADRLQPARGPHSYGPIHYRGERGEYRGDCRDEYRGDRRDDYYREQPRHRDSPRRDWHSRDRPNHDRAPPPRRPEPATAPPTSAAVTGPIQSSAPAPTHSYPNVDNAPLDEFGLPVFPEPVCAEDVSDYEGTDDSETEARKTQNARASEKIRLGNALRKANQSEPSPAAPPFPEASVSGVWTGLDYSKALTTAYRSEGTRLLLRRQGEADSAWLRASTGDPTPRSRRPNADGTIRLSRNARRRLARTRTPWASLFEQFEADVAQNFEHPETSEALSDNPVAPIAPNLPVALPSQSYLGTATAPDGYVATPSGHMRPTHHAPNTPLATVLADLVAEPPLSWDDGIRLADGRWVDSDSPVGSCPAVDDVLAARFLHHIAPRDDALLRVRFWEFAITGLSVFGFFERFIRRGEWRATVHPLEHYPFATMSMNTVLAWIYFHGVHPDTADMARLRSFAISARNSCEGSNDPASLTFAVGMFPRAPDDVLRLPDSPGVAPSTEEGEISSPPPHTPSEDVEMPDGTASTDAAASESTGDGFIVVDPAAEAANPDDDALSY